MTALWWIIYLDNFLDKIWFGKWGIFHCCNYLIATLLWRSKSTGNRVIVFFFLFCFFQRSTNNTLREILEKNRSQLQIFSRSAWEHINTVYLLEWNHGKIIYNIKSFDYTIYSSIYSELKNDYGTFTVCLINLLQMLMWNNKFMRFIVILLITNKLIIGWWNILTWTFDTYISLALNGTW